MRTSGKILHEILLQLVERVAVGVTPLEIDILAAELCKKRQVTPSFLGYHGYPAISCICVNDEVVHGIPGDRPFEDGDVVTIDMGVVWQGYHSDSARTVYVGDIEKNPEVKKFLTAGAEALAIAQRLMGPGKRLGDIGEAIETFVEDVSGYFIIRELSGHGIGTKLHEEPYVMNYGTAGTGLTILPGMAFALEPIVAMKRTTISTRPDGWTIVSRDGVLSCQFENTVIVTEQGCDIVT